MDVRRQETRDEATIKKHPINIRQLKKQHLSLPVGLYDKGTRNPDQGGELQKVSILSFDYSNGIRRRQTCVPHLRGSYNKGSD